MPRVSRCLAMLLVAVSLFFSFPLLSQEHGRSRGVQRSGAASVVDLFALGWRSLTRLVAGTGSGLDPDGAPAPPPSPQTSAVAHITVKGVTGSGLDPNG
jgi:hypothetical protein